MRLIKTGDIKFRMKKEKIKKAIVKAIQFIANPRLLLCFGIAWMITNGWSYIMFGIGTYYGINWMIAVAGAYLAFLWLPFTPEKIITVAISMGLLRLLFPKDEKTLAVLRQMRVNAKTKKKKRKEEKEEETEKTPDSDDTEDKMNN